MSDNDEQTRVLRQHEIGQQALSGVIKGMTDKQPPQPTVTGTGPTVTEVDDDNGGVLDFQGGPSPYRPPDKGSFSMVIESTQIPNHMEVEKQN